MRADNDGDEGRHETIFIKSITQDRTRKYRRQNDNEHGHSGRRRHSSQTPYRTATPVGFVSLEAEMHLPRTLALLNVTDRAPVLRL